MQTAAGVGAAFVVDWRATLFGIGLCLIGLTLTWLYIQGWNK